MKTRNILLTIAIALAMIQLTSCKGTGTKENPLLSASEVPFGAPDFSVIQESDYLPAIEASIEMKREDVKKIVENEETPTFENTILALEESGQNLDRVTTFSSPS